MLGVDIKVYSYVTLLSNDDYLAGVISLNNMLLNLNSKYGLVVCLSMGVSKDTELYINKNNIQTFRIKENFLELSEEQKKKYGHWTHTFDKIYIFSMIAYKKLVYLDSDMMILENIDHLFTKEHMSSVASGKLDDERCTRMNSGLMVIEPQEGLGQAIYATFNDAVEFCNQMGQQRIGDQDLINFFYSDWPNQTSKHLPEQYNLFIDQVDKYISFGYVSESKIGLENEIKIIHFIGSRKPWMFGSTFVYVKDFIKSKFYRKKQFKYFIKYKFITFKYLLSKYF